jgi:hypothetical protein
MVYPHFLQLFHWLPGSNSQSYTQVPLEMTDDITQARRSVYVEEEGHVDEKRDDVQVMFDNAKAATGEWK